MPHEALLVSDEMDVETLAARLREREAIVERLQRELEETNRGVVALYAELDERAEALKRASDLKSAFLSNVSHELRTPIVSVINLTRLMLEDGPGAQPLGEEARRSLGFISRAAQTLYEMVNDLLDLAKIEAGKVDVRIAPVRLADVFSALRGMFRPLVNADRVAQVFAAPPPDLELATDEGKLSQILRNLISNAVKFTERGEVRVTASVPEPGHVSIEVADTGVGIAPEHLERIFHEFEQVEGTHQRRVRGTGLGLPLSRRMAGLLGGTIDVTSVPRRGSVFTLRMPMHTPIPANEATESGGAE
jgi:signal transduction histidine kinase